MFQSFKKMFESSKKKQVPPSKPISISAIRQENPDGPYPFYDGKTILSSIEFSRMVEEIRLRFSGVDSRWFDGYVRPILEWFAEFVQATPASDLSHHMCAYGLLEHTLEVLLGVLQDVKSRRYFIPEPFERQYGITNYIKAAQLCAVVVVLAHDMGKVKTDITVSLYDNDGRKLDKKYNYNCDRGGLCSYSMFQWYLDASKQLGSSELTYAWGHNPNRAAKHVKYRQTFIDTIRVKFSELLNQTAQLAPYLLQVDAEGFSEELRETLYKYDAESTIRGLHPAGDEISKCFEASFRMAIKFLGREGRLNPLPIVSSRYIFLPKTELKELLEYLPDDDTYQPLLFDPVRPDERNSAEYVLKRIQGHGLAVLTDESYENVSLDKATSLRWFENQLGVVLNVDLTNEYVVALKLGKKAQLPQATPSSPEDIDAETPAPADNEQAHRQVQPQDETKNSTPPKDEALQPAISEHQDDSIGELLSELLKAQVKNTDKLITRVGQSLGFSINWLNGFEVRTGIECVEIERAAPQGVKEHFSLRRSDRGILTGILVHRPFADGILRNNGIDPAHYFLEDDASE